MYTIDTFFSVYLSIRSSVYLTKHKCYFKTLKATTTNAGQNFNISSKHIHFLSHLSLKLTLILIFTDISPLFFLFFSN